MQQVAVVRSAQGLRTSEWSDHRDTRCIDRRHHHQRGWRTDGAHQCKHLVDFDQRRDGRSGFVRLIAAVAQDQLELAAIDATGCICRRSMGKRPIASAPNSAVRPVSAAN